MCYKKDLRALGSLVPYKKRSGTVRYLTSLVDYVILSGQLLVERCTGFGGFINECSKTFYQTQYIGIFP